MIHSLSSKIESSYVETELPHDILKVTVEVYTEPRPCCKPWKHTHLLNTAHRIQANELIMLDSF